MDALSSSLGPSTAANDGTAPTSTHSSENHPSDSSTVYGLLAVLGVVILLRVAVAARGIWKLVRPAESQVKPPVLVCDGECTLLGSALELAERNRQRELV